MFWFQTDDDNVVGDDPIRFLATLQGPSRSSSVSAGSTAVFSHFCQLTFRWIRTRAPWLAKAWCSLRRSCNLLFCPERPFADSMKRLCADDGWQCLLRVNRVNNFKVAANRRARVSSEITIAPYDVSFPKATIWAVQMLKDVCKMLALSICNGALAGVAVLLLAKAEAKL